MTYVVGHDGLGHFYGSSLIDSKTDKEIPFLDILEKGDKISPTDITDAGEFGISILETSIRSEALNKLGIDLDGIQGKEGPRGPEGPEGPPGPVGPAGLIWKHQWNSESTYIADDAVGYAGASWFCLQESTGNEPNEENSQYWALLASQGARGPAGPEGPAGIQGQSGENGIDGANGSNGKDGVGITEITTGYKTSTSPTSIPTGSWSSDIPVVTQGQYLWTRAIFKLTNNTSYPQYTVSYQAINGTNGKDAVFKVSDLTEADIQSLYSRLRPLKPQKFWAYRMLMPTTNGNSKTVQLADMNLNFRMTTTSADSVKFELIKRNDSLPCLYAVKRFTVFGSTSLEGNNTTGYRSYNFSSPFVVDDYDYADMRSEWRMKIIDSTNKVFYIVQAMMNVEDTGRILYLEVNKVGEEGYVDV